MPRFNPATKINPRDESGFTLLEIIAVLVILSIMAVVAVPKYFDLQTQARQEAIKTAMAEAIGRVNGHFAKEVLGGTAPKDIQYTKTELGEDLGDFSWTITEIAATEDEPKQLSIQVTADEGSALAGETATRQIPVPGL